MKDKRIESFGTRESNVPRACSLSILAVNPYLWKRCYLYKPPFSIK